MTSRSLKTLLIVSLVFNVFLIGGIAGGVYRWKTAPAPQQAAGQHGLRFAADELGPPYRQTFRSMLREARQDARSDMQTGRADRRDMFRLLSAPDLDKPALNAALDRTRRADMALRTRIEEGVVDFAASLTPEQRQVFSRGLSNVGPLRQPLRP